MTIAVIDPADKQRIEIFVRGGWSDEKIAALYGASKQAVSRFRKRHGIGTSVGPRGVIIDYVDPAAVHDRHDLSLIYGAKRYEDVCDTLLRYEFLHERRAPRHTINIAELGDPKYRQAFPAPPDMNTNNQPGYRGPRS